VSNIGFIGAGNMAQSIIGGLLSAGTPKATLWATARSEEKRHHLQTHFDVNVTDNNITAVEACRVLVLAVKPQMMFGVCEQIAPYIREKLIISVAAGISCDSLSKWLGPEAAIIRCMPNTPSLIGQGAAGLYANSNVSILQKQVGESILKAAGTVHWVKDEALIHTVTAVSGSGPAYFFMFLEAMINAAIEQGLDPETARALAIQTAKGAALLAEQSSDNLETLRKKVTSPGGTTEQAIISFEQNGLRKTVAAAMDACAKRSQQMAKELG
jgi:pyrroline-5-carboxylate reductase